MKARKQAIMIVFIVIICCSIMAVIDGVIQPSYWIKSGIKVVLFLLCPAAYCMFNRDCDLKAMFKPSGRGLMVSLVLGVLVFTVITLSYELLKNVFDFSSITGALAGGVGVNKDNFLYVSLYISMVNSLLEEFFFRGFAFLALKQNASRPTAYLFSCLSFALYHTAMMTGWFSIWVFLLVMIGLAAGGAIFNYLNEKLQCIYPSWIVHMCANLGINFIGMKLFGII